MPSTFCALLVASLGNTGRLQNTRHSAGHILLKALAQRLDAPPFSRSKSYGSGQLTTATLSPSFHSRSHSEDPPVLLHLWSSPTLMNVSGPAVLAAWRAFCKDNNTGQSDYSHAADSPSAHSSNRALGLILLHDDLESRLGKLRARQGFTKSTRGHNGLKSVVASFSGAGMVKEDGSWMVRVGIGIGRPSSGGREREEVSDYVLAKCTPGEVEKIEETAGQLEVILQRESKRLMKGVLTG